MVCLLGSLPGFDGQSEGAIIVYAIIIHIVISGLLMGGIYALIAIGLNLQFGVARVLNVSHGEFIMLGAFITWALFTVFGINPLVSLAIVGPIILVIGFILYKTLYRSLRISSGSAGAFEGSSMLASFGLLFIIQNLVILTWGAEPRGYSFLTFPIHLGGAIFPTNRLAILVFALGIGLIFYLFLARTRLGKAIRAAAQDQVAAELMGVNINQVLAICFGLGALMAGLGGSLLSMSFPIEATMGFPYTMIALIVIVLGGLGSISGSFIGGFLLGIVGSIVSHFEPGLTLAAFYVLVMLMLIVRPTGIGGK